MTFSKQLVPLFFLLFFLLATSNSAFTQSMLPSCKIVKRLHFPAISPFEEAGFSTYLNNQSLSLQWNSPNCKDCEVDNLRCGIKNKTSLEVKSLDAKKTSGYLSINSIVVIICVSVVVGVIFSDVCMGVLHCLDNLEDSDYPGRPIAAMQASTVAHGTSGLDQSTIDSYKKMELAENRRLPGTNGIVCPICLSEYASKDTVRFIPECNHCFHVACIDVWLKIHGSCPLCRKTHA